MAGASSESPGRIRRARSSVSRTASAPSTEPGPAANGATEARASVTLAIETVGLRKTYGGQVALHDLSLAVQPGEVFGFLGPNGAGKTTTVKILLGLARPTSGSARIFGRPTGDRDARRRIGYLPESFRFHDWLTGEALLDFHGRLAGMSAEERRQRIPSVVELVGLAGREGERIRGYSKGMTQRIGLAQALLARPDLVLLDEPTSALDPIGRREVRDVIRGLRADGVTVFLNSHLLSEIEMVCDRVAIVDRGRVVRSGRLIELMASRPELRISLDRVDRELRRLLEAFGEVLEVDGATVALAVPDLEVAPAVAECVVRHGYRLFGLVPAQQSLEDVFLSLVERAER
ncbi:MAG: ABC transporter ATP-binding protein [Chloroflexi bacterium]|nr:ABC transporter ATP-binding protein [Chloroflexota bacterium]